MLDQVLKGDQEDLLCLRVSLPDVPGLLVADVAHFDQILNDIPEKNTSNRLVHILVTARVCH
jgi:hypothetical protein